MKKPREKIPFQRRLELYVARKKEVQAATDPKAAQAKLKALFQYVNSYMKPKKPAE